MLRQRVLAKRVPVVALAGIVVLGGCGQSAVTSSAHGSPSPRSQSPAGETHSVAPSVAPSDHGDLSDWSQVASFETETLGVVGLVHGPAGYVAIGHDLEGSTPTAGGSARRGRVWLSPDGLSWELLPPDDVFARAVLILVVVARDGSYLAFGRIEGTSGQSDEVLLAVWESADGRSWRRTQIGLSGDLVATRVVAGNEGYLLAGARVDPQRYELWLSADARSWEVVRALPPTTGAVYEDIDAIAAGPEGFVAAGYRGQDVYVIASGDGREWFEAPPISGLGPVPAIAPLAEDWIMALGQTSPLPVWFSPNGLDWERVATLGSASDGYRGLSLVSTGDRVFAQLTAFAGSSDGNPAGVWSSSDGTTWEEIDAASDHFLAGAASSGDTTVLVSTGAVFFARRLT